MLLEALALMVCIGVAIVVLFTPVQHLHNPLCIFSFWLAKLGWKRKIPALLRQERAVVVEILPSLGAHKGYGAPKICIQLS